jgi:hypothetical protein
MMLKSLLQNQYPTYTKTSKDSSGRIGRSDPSLSSTEDAGQAQLIEVEQLRIHALWFI